jgi:hypothetical protein
MSSSGAKNPERAFGKPLVMSPMRVLTIFWAKPPPRHSQYKRPFRNLFCGASASKNMKTMWKRGQSGSSIPWRGNSKSSDVLVHYRAIVSHYHNLATGQVTPHCSPPKVLTPRIPVDKYCKEWHNLERHLRMEYFKDRV